MTLTKQDLDNAERDLKTVSAVSNSKDPDSGASIDSYQTRLGDSSDTLAGRLKLMGYITPVAYAAGISFTALDNAKTVEEAGVVYAPRPSALPFTTSGSFVGDDDANFFVVQGVLNSDLPKYIAAEFADVVNAIAGVSQNLDSVDFSDYVGRLVSTAVNNSASKKGGEIYIVKTLSQAAADGDVIDGVGGVGVNHACGDGVHCLVKSKQLNQFKPQIAFMFDDATRGHYDAVWPLFKSLNLPASFAVTVKFTDDIQQSGTRLSVSEILKMQKEGAEIVNHTMTHDNMSAATSIERVAAQSETARQWLTERGVNITGFLAASSAVTQTLLGPIVQSHNYAMTVAANNVIPDVFITKQSMPYSLPRYAMEGQTSSAVIDAIKQAINNNSSLILYDHVINDPSSAFTRLSEVLAYLGTVDDLIDVVLPRDLVANAIGVNNNQDNYTGGEQIYHFPDGWSFSAGLNYTVATDTIRLRPSVTGPQTGTIDLEVEEGKTYTFSNNVRSSNFQGTIRMGAHCINALNEVIPNYSVEGGLIEYDADFLHRHYITTHTAPGTVKLRLFYRINPTVINTTLLIKDPILCTGRKITYEDVPQAHVITVDDPDAPYTPDLSGGLRSFFYRLDDVSNTINAPINVPDATEFTKITFYLRANATNRSIVWDATYRLNPKTRFNPNATRDIMIISFRWYKSRWVQVSDTAWCS